MSEQKNHTVRNTVAGVGVVALLALLLGGNFGLGGGGESGGESALPAKSEKESVSATAAPTMPPTAEPDDGVITVTVQEDKLLYEGKSVTFTELGGRLLNDFKDGRRVELEDDHAVKGSYDEVVALLQRLSIEYTEK